MANVMEGIYHFSLRKSIGEKILTPLNYFSVRKILKLVKGMIHVKKGLLVYYAKIVILWKTMLSRVKITVKNVGAIKGLLY